MREENLHLSEEELLLAAECELPSAVEARVREHLVECSSCRERASKIETSIADFVVARRQSFSSRLPPPSEARALLRAHLNEIARKSSPSFASRWLTSAVSRYGPAYAAAALFLATIVIWQMSHARRALMPATKSEIVASLAMPNRALTPGAIRAVTRKDVCKAQGAEGSQQIPEFLQREVFEEYGMPNARPEDYELDYLITPELGGSADVRNLWPEPHSRTEWNSYTKDALENRLHELVCGGQLDLGTAQRDISKDWIAAYKEYFHTDRPISN